MFNKNWNEKKKYHRFKSIIKSSHVFSVFKRPGRVEMFWLDDTDLQFSCVSLLVSCAADDSFSHYSLSVHGCRLSLFYWPDVSAARPVKFLWKLEQVLGERQHSALMFSPAPFPLCLYLEVKLKQRRHNSQLFIISVSSGPSITALFKNMHLLVIDTHQVKSTFIVTHPHTKYTA